MEEKSWIWAVNAISSCVQETICCINIFPILIFKNKTPYKLIYTNVNGRLAYEISPSLEQVKQIFERSLISSYKIAAFDIQGRSETFLSDKLDSFYFTSDFIAIQGFKEPDAVYHHKIEYADRTYSSHPYIVKVGLLVPLNDLALEKYFLVYSINCVHLIEKTQNLQVNSIEFVFFRDNLGKHWIKSADRFSVLRMDVHRPSILQSKLVISSKGMTKPSQKINKSISFGNLKRQPLSLKPKIAISKAKISSLRPFVMAFIVQKKLFLARLSGQGR